MKEPTVRTVYYDDERADDFAGVTRPPYKVPASHDYAPRSLLRRAAAFFVYRCVMTPFAFLYMKIRFGYRLVRAAKLPEKGRGFFLYANHTLLAGDAFSPSLAVFPRKARVIVSPDNVALPATRGFILLCGALPLPSTPAGARAFLGGLKNHLADGACVAVYPEAHIWPYCGWIRDFPDDSFRYPVKFGVPAYAATTTFSRRRFRKTPRVTVYLDGPFSPEGDDRRQAQKNLRDAVFRTMTERAKNSAWSPVRYEKRKQGENAT